MLKYGIGTIMKNKNSLFLSLILLFLAVKITSTVYSQIGISILNLSDDEILQGIQVIRGNTAIEGFSSYLVQFSTISHPDDWFNIIESTSSVQNDILAEWDTTIISDGNYNLRLIVLFENGDLLIKQVNNLRVRNYTATETPIPTIESSSINTIIPTSTLMPTVIYPTATELPENPAILTKSNLNRSALFGMIGAIVLILPISIFQYIKQKRKY